MKTVRSALCLLSMTSILFLCSISSAQTPSLPQMAPLVELEGSWKEIGRKTAYYFSDSIKTGSEIFAMVFKITDAEVREEYRKIESSIPHGVKEQLQGMALGLTEYCNIPYEKAWNMVLIWNFGIDMNTKHQMEKEINGCTAFALHSEAGTFLAHNTDNMAGTEGTGATMYFKPDNGDNAFLSFFSPGFVGVGIGINEKGLALTFNVGRPNKSATTGLPALFLTREVMAKCSTLSDAVDRFKKFIADGGKFSYQGSNFLLVDFKDSSMARLQICSDDIKVTYGKELKPGVTFVACTNLFDDDYSPMSQKGMRKPKNISAKKRFERLMQILPEFEAYDLETCWKILSDSCNATPNNNTICRDGAMIDTTDGHIFTNDKINYTIGKPCVYLKQYGKPKVIDLDQIVKPSISGNVTKFWLSRKRVKVELESVSGGNLKFTTYTDNKGRFCFNNLDPGTYQLRVKTSSKSKLKNVVYNGSMKKSVNFRFFF